MELEVETYTQIKELLREGQRDEAVQHFSSATGLDAEESAAYVGQIAAEVDSESEVPAPASTPPVPAPSIAPPPTASVDFLASSQEKKRETDYREPKKSFAEKLWPFRFAMRHILCLAQVAVMYFMGGILGAICGAIGYLMNMKVFRAGHFFLVALLAYLAAIVASLALYVVGAVAMDLFLPSEEVEKYRKFDVSPFLPMDKIREFVPISSGEAESSSEAPLSSEDEPLEDTAPSPDSEEPIAQ